MNDDYNSNYNQMGYQDAYDPQNPYEKPLDPAVERVRRKLMRLMIISVSVTMLLIVAVLIAVIYKVITPQTEKKANEVTPISELTPDIKTEIQTLPPEIPKFINRTIALPEGTRILSQSLSGNLIALETLTPEGGTEMIIYDYKNGHLIAGITLGTSSNAERPMAMPETPSNEK
ncbi:hypothetical protein [Bartonella tamiae]|uniref:Fimbrial subunit PilA n=1 Tax=Bartonella tamiae Th239 TaxID=1094558 RepID=J0R7B6_9HYPH|nr:hypothetical protein [Bartonella tamiae]EJF91629.1 hypothetical protein ME5_00008 [Bartonella tamiae Th239]EJF92696.1 hypothetical protein MEG_01866 [Bartonella tamiae Th307]